MRKKAAAESGTFGIDASSASINAYDLVVGEIMVEVGDVVRAGQILMILEYNKIVTEVTTPAPGSVAAIRCRTGDEVQVGERLIDIRPA